MTDAGLDFSGETAIVTGAAHGIGRAICAELAARGATVWAVDILADDLEATRQVVGERRGRCETRLVDVTAEQEVAALARDLDAQNGPDILVNCAGGVLGQTGRPVEEVPLDDWSAILAVNLTGTFLCSRAVAPGMKRRGYGRIVNISSGAGRSVSLTGVQAYASAKAGQIGLTRQLAHELGPFGITVNAIAPGFIRSNPTTERQWESYGPERQRALVEGLALKRLGTPEDIACAVLYFASDMARWCTGQVLSVDGGHAMF
jgi:3-oxoacyl-[acyl-carrier protein] reductase